MRAFVMHEIGSVGFIEKPPPVPGPLDAVVRTTTAFGVIKPLIQFAELALPAAAAASPETAGAVA